MNQMKASSKDGSVAWMRSTRTADSDSASSKRGSAPAGSDTRIVVPRNVVPGHRAASSA